MADNARLAVNIRLDGADRHNRAARFGFHEVTDLGVEDHILTSAEKANFINKLHKKKKLLDKREQKTYTASQEGRTQC
jgi:hypothetical protein